MYLIKSPSLISRSCFSLINEAVIRRRISSSASISQREKPVETKEVERARRRFWKQVSIQENKDSYTITLDKRPLKVPGGSPLVIPKNRRALAYLVAGEWESQNALLKHHSLPLTSLVARAIVAFEKDSDEKKDAVERLLKYLDTDSICFRHNHPQTLVDLQRQHWDPLIDWIQSHYSVRINTTEGIFKHPHPSETYEKLSNIVSKFDSLKLAAFERAAMLSKSFIIGLGLVERRLSVEEAVQAAQVEVNAQIMGWGEVEDAHDVDREDIRRQLGSVVVALINENVQ